MSRMTTAIARLAGLGALLVVATSLPASVRPVIEMPKAKPAKAVPAPNTQPPRREIPNSNDADPAMFVSVDVGVVWSPAHSTGLDRVSMTELSSGNGPTPVALLCEQSGNRRPQPSVVDQAATAPSVVRNLQSFLSSQRSLAPPRA